MLIGQQTLSKTLEQHTYKSPYPRNFLLSQRDRKDILEIKTLGQNCLALIKAPSTGFSAILYQYSRRYCLVQSWVRSIGAKSRSGRLRKIIAAGKASSCFKDLNLFAQVHTWSSWADLNQGLVGLQYR